MTEPGGAGTGVEEVLSRFGTQAAPLVIDVRRPPAFEASDAVIAGCIRHEPDSVASWSGAKPAGRDVVVYCAHGQEVSQRAAAALRAAGHSARFLAGGFQAWQDIGGPLVARHEHLTSGKPSLWVTRERPKIDRVACPWLIRRFVDPMARFLYTPTENVFAMAEETSAIPYDIPGAEPFTHDGPLCSFDTIIRHFAIRDPALEYLALIVRGADTARLDLTPESAGLLAITLGLSANCGEDDQSMLEASMATYDALYTWCRRPEGGDSQLDPSDCGSARMSASVDKPAEVPQRVPISSIVLYFLRLGSLGFGGPAALCGQMEKELVGEKHWVTRDEMREAIAISQSMPGPLAIQVGIFIAHMRGGFWGAWAGGWAFILPNFVIVAALGALYVYLGGFTWMTAIFYGVAPTVIALIAHSCWRLAKLGVDDKMQWVIAAVAFGITVALEAEVALLFIVAGIFGVLWYGTIFRRPSAEALALFIMPAKAVGVAGPAAATATLPGLLWFFLKAGSLTFGSGLVIVPFLEKGLVQETGWLNPREFLIAVAIGMISPGPVVITATFVGYIVAGFWGSLVSTVGIFLPSFLMVLIVAPILRRHRANTNVQGFIKGTYAAAIGTILGACVLLGKIAIGDWLTAVILVVSLGLLFRFKVNNPALVAACAVIGVVAYPILKPTFVFVQ